MIHIALNFINTELNNFAQLRYGQGSSSSPFCSLQNLAWLSGGSSGLTNGTPLVGSLIHVAEDRIAKQPDWTLRSGNVVYNVNPAVPINLYCMFAGATDTGGNYDSTSYVEALKAISIVIRFFQSKNVFTPANSNLDQRITQLIAEMYTLSFQELNDVWMANGGKYYPSVIYKLRTLFYQEDPQEVAGLITQVNVNVNGN
jgi:hypothetical protein